MIMKLRNKSISQEEFTRNYIKFVDLSTILHTLDDMDYDVSEFDDLVAFIDTYYRYTMKLLINQFDLQPVARYKSSVYFLFGGVYLPFKVKYLENEDMNLDKFEIDHSYLVKKSREKRLDECLIKFEQLGKNYFAYEMQWINFDIMFEFMKEYVAGNKPTVETLRKFRDDSKVISVQMVQ